jgi:hypothetical protein
MRSREWHEGNREHVPAAERAVGALLVDEEVLSCPGLADRYDHRAAGLELLDEGGISTGAAVTMMPSNGACSDQPR